VNTVHQDAACYERHPVVRVTSLILALLVTFSFVVPFLHAHSDAQSKHTCSDHPGGHGASDEGTADAGTCHGCPCGHMHSHVLTAWVEPAFVLFPWVLSSGYAVATATPPLSPIGEIDHPPQLS